LKGLLTPTTPLSFADMQHLSLLKRAKLHSARIAPPWAFNREAIKKIITERLRRYCLFTGAKKEDVEKARNSLAALDALARESQRRLRKFDSPRFAKSYHVAEHLKSVETRSLAALWIYILYASYRLGSRSTDVAEVIGISPWSVRQNLRRLNQVARAVCPDLCVPSRVYDGPLSRQEYLDRKISEVEQQVERAAKSKRYRSRVPVYEARLTELRKMKEARDAEQKTATIFSSSAHCAAA